ncbi:hypothetical protein ACLMJK_004718 [Lecanora helva]
MACKAMKLMVADFLLGVTIISTTAILAVYNSGDMNILDEIYYMIHEQFFKDPNNNIFVPLWYINAVIHPSAPVFCFAVSLYAFSSTAFYRLHARDRYQNHVLAVFAIAGVLVPILCGVEIVRWKDTWQASLPLSYTSGLILSAFGHLVWRLMPRDHLQEKLPYNIDDYDFDWDRKVEAGRNRHVMRQWVR